MDVQVNMMGVTAAVAVSMVVGGIWYNKQVFGKVWMQLEKIDEKQAKKDAPKALAGMAVMSLLMAYILAHVTYLSASFYDTYTYQSAAVSTAFWMWLGFVLPVVVSTSLFNQRPWKLTAIHAGNWLVTLIGMGIVIGWIGL